jgi:hypothetical protein
MPFKDPIQVPSSEEVILKTLLEGKNLPPESETSPFRKEKPCQQSLKTSK